MQQKKTEHAVIIRFLDFASKFWSRASHDLSPLFELEGALQDTLRISGAGELDGHEIATDGSCGRIYGADADALFAAVEPVLSKTAIMQGANAMLRYGGVNEPDVLKKYIAIKVCV
jgi:hypothetical protein